MSRPTAHLLAALCVLVNMALALLSLHAGGWGGWFIAGCCLGCGIAGVAVIYVDYPNYRNEWKR